MDVLAVGDLTTRCSQLCSAAAAASGCCVHVWWLGPNISTNL